MLIKTDSFTLATYAKGDSNSKKLALVLPGKLDSKDYAHMISHVDYLASLGYFALSFDPPGTWESPGDISLYTMTNYLKAINELIKYYGNKPTFVMGHSRGASMTILSGLTNPFITSFASIFSSFTEGGYKDNSDITRWKEKGYLLEKRDLPPGGGPKIREFKLPYGFFEDQLRYDVAKDLEHSNKPKLFMLGKRDVLAVPEVIKQLYSITSDPKELYELDSDHNYRFHPELIEEVNKVVGDFLYKYNQI
jgi:pimeloyl-ACP methyl ester carboxylesterase